MVFDILRKTFGLQKKGTPPPTEPETIENDEDRIVAFVKFVVTNLVEYPQDVDVEPETGPQRIKLQIKCNKSDIGKVIGKKGKTVSAIRALANGAARRAGKKVSIDVLD